MSAAREWAMRTGHLTILASLSLGACGGDDDVMMTADGGRTEGDGGGGEVDSGEPDAGTPPSFAPFVYRYNEEDDETVSAILPLPGGDLLLAGTVTDIRLGREAILARVAGLGDSAGQVMWQTKISTEVSDVPLAILPWGEAQYGVLVVTGTRAGGITENDLLVHVFDEDGGAVEQVVWSAPDQSLNPKAAFPTEDGAIVVGDIRPEGLSQTSGWVGRLRRDGSVAWGFQIGGDRGDTFSSVAEAGGLFVALGGTFSVGDVFDQDLFLVAFDAEGAVQWQQAIGTDELEVDGHVVGLADGSFLVYGHSGKDAQMDKDLVLIRVGADGAIQSQTRIGTEGGEDTAGDAVALPGGGFALTASRRSETSIDGVLLLADAEGTVQTQRFFSEEGAFMSLRRLAATEDGIFGAGFIEDNTGMENSELDWYLVATSPTGEIPAACEGVTTGDPAFTAQAASEQEVRPTEFDRPGSLPTGVEAAVEATEVTLSARLTCL